MFNIILSHWALYVFLIWSLVIVVANLLVSTNAKSPRKRGSIR